jgi:hypothetical protein
MGRIFKIKYLCYHFANTPVVDVILLEVTYVLDLKIIFNFN